MTRKIELIPVQLSASPPEVMEYLRNLVMMAHRHKIEEIDISGVLRKNGSFTTIDFVWPAELEEEF